MVNSITIEELKALMTGDRKPSLIDVRRKADFEAAPKTIESAIRLDPEKVDEWFAELPQDKPVIVYCVRGGSVSRGIAERLQRDHPDVKFLDGGINAWIELGEPVKD